MPNRRVSPLVVPVLFAICSVLFACTTVPDAGRPSFNFIPNTHLSQMGLTEFEKIKTQKRRSNNSSQTASVNRVAERMKRIVP
ncbi:MAG: hypothetical protein ACKO8Z_13920, partial [Prosthecobacter sp.]